MESAFHDGVFILTSVSYDSHEPYWLAKCKSSEQQGMININWLQFDQFDNDNNEIYKLGTESSISIECVIEKVSLQELSDGRFLCAKKDADYFMRKSKQFHIDSDFVDSAGEPKRILAKVSMGNIKQNLVKWSVLPTQNATWEKDSDIPSNLNSKFDNARAKMIISVTNDVEIDDTKKIPIPPTELAAKIKAANNSLDNTKYFDIDEFNNPRSDQRLSDSGKKSLDPVKKEQSNKRKRNEDKTELTTEKNDYAALSVLQSPSESSFSNYATLSAVSSVSPDLSAKMSLGEMDDGEEDDEFSLKKKVPKSDRKRGRPRKFSTDTTNLLTSMPPVNYSGRALTLEEAQNAVQQQQVNAFPSMYPVGIGSVDFGSNFGQITSLATMPSLPKFTTGSYPKPTPIMTTPDGHKKKKYYRTLKEIEAEPDPQQRAMWKLERERILNSRKEQRILKKAVNSGLNPIQALETLKREKILSGEYTEPPPIYVPGIDISLQASPPFISSLIECCTQQSAQPPVLPDYMDLYKTQNMLIIAQRQVQQLLTQQAQNMKCYFFSNLINDWNRVPKDKPLEMLQEEARSVLKHCVDSQKEFAQQQEIILSSVNAKLIELFVQAQQKFNSSSFDNSFQSLDQQQQGQTQDIFNQNHIFDQHDMIIGNPQ